MCGGVGAGDVWARSLAACTRCSPNSSHSLSALAPLSPTCAGGLRGASKSYTACLTPPLCPAPPFPATRHTWRPPQQHALGLCNAQRLEQLGVLQGQLNDLHRGGPGRAGQQGLTSKEAGGWGQKAGQQVRALQLLSKWRAAHDLARPPRLGPSCRPPAAPPPATTYGQGPEPPNRVPSQPVARGLTPPCSPAMAPSPN